MTDSNRKGSRAERELVGALADEGWGVLRAPASGSGTTRSLPDVLAGQNGTMFAFELKSSSDETLYLDSEEVAELKTFCRFFGGLPRIAVRFNEEHGDPTYGEDIPGIYVLRPSALYRTEEGNYRVKKETALEQGALYTAL
jgi:Holliday junction resolvase